MTENNFFFRNYFIDTFVTCFTHIHFKLFYKAWTSMQFIKNLLAFSTTFFKLIVNHCFLQNRRWTVENGIDGETCTDWKRDDTDLWCDYVMIPNCVDRTIYCTGITFFIHKILQIFRRSSNMVLFFCCSNSACFACKTN